MGNQKGILIPELSRYRSSLTRLSGLRCLHTHLSQEPLTEDDLTDLALLRLDLMGAITLNRDTGIPQFYHLAYLLPTNQDGKGWYVSEPIRFGTLDIDFEALMNALEEEFSRAQRVHPLTSAKERAILVSVTTGEKESAKRSLEELEKLAYSAGVQVVDKIIQRRKRIDPKFFIGKGKVSELAIRALQLGVDLLIFDRELNPSQVKALSKFTDLRVIDRTQLILDIFAQRARSREGKIQVEMAQLKYILPRLVLQDASMSRLAGGIGGRGPGETKLEIDRRRIKERINRLQKEIKEIRKERAYRRLRRHKANIPIISIIGYTNAGKSTLLNALTKSSVLVEDKLFATLDPTSRILRFPENREAIITDTVGFIRDLPNDLMEAFSATLEELREANLLILLIDISDPEFPEQIEAVERILERLELTHIPIIRVFNKEDLVDKEFVSFQCKRYEAISISALVPSTLSRLIKEIERRLGKLPLFKWQKEGLKTTSPLPESTSLA